jgi:hypothetical protein
MVSVSFFYLPDQPGQDQRIEQGRGKKNKNNTTSQCRDDIFVNG